MTKRAGRVLIGNPDGNVMSYRLECLSEEDVIHLAAGLVPPQLRSQCMALLDFDTMLERNAERPVKKSKRESRYPKDGY